MESFWAIFSSEEKLGSVELTNFNAESSLSALHMGNRTNEVWLIRLDIMENT